MNHAIPTRHITVNCDSAGDCGSRQLSHSSARARGRLQGSGNVRDRHEPENLCTETADLADKTLDGISRLLGCRHSP